MIRRADISGIMWRFYNSGNFLPSALLFSIVFWFADAFVDSYVFHEGRLLELALRPDSGNVYIRLFVGVMFMIFAWHSSALTKKREAAARRAEESLRITASVFECASESIIVTDLDGNIITVNPAFTTITGWQASEVIGKNPRILKSGKHDSRFYADMWNSILRDGRWDGELWNRRKSGEIVPEWVTIASVKEPDGGTSLYIGISRDMTAWHKSGSKMEFHAYHDALTGLPNRLLFEDRLHQAIASARRNGTSAGVLFMDLDRFKT